MNQAERDGSGAFDFSLKFGNASDLAIQRARTCTYTKQCLYEYVISQNIPFPTFWEDLLVAYCCKECSFYTPRKAQLEIDESKFKP